MAFISINDDHIFYNLRKDKWREWNRSSKIMKLERKWAKSRIASRCWIRGSSSLHILSRVRSEFRFVRIFLRMPQSCLWLHFSKLTFGLLLVWQHCLKSMLKALQNTKWSSFFKVFTWGFKKIGSQSDLFYKNNCSNLSESFRIFEILVLFYNFARKIIRFSIF